jgi:hypothetical protein
VQTKAVSKAYPEISGRQAFTADAATIGDDFAAVLGGHAGTETEFAFPRDVVWLEGSFHFSSPSYG